jgi:hypothetical protein
MNSRISKFLHLQLRRAMLFVSSTLPVDPLDAMLPVNPAISDLYLVSYPKSGSTWLAFMLGNVNLLMSGVDRRTTFFGLHDVIPDIHISRHIPEPSASFPGFRMIKCHSFYNPKYHKVILLVRNPVDVMASYYKYMVEQGLYSGTIRELVDHPSFGIAAWNAHTASWLDGAHADFSYCSLCLIKYEQIRADPAAVLRELYSHMGFDLPEKIIATAVERASFAAMRTDEDRLNARHPKRAQFEFVRKVEALGPRVEIDTELGEKIRAATHLVMKRLGYS